MPQGRVSTEVAVCLHWCPLQQSGIRATARQKRSVVTAVRHTSHSPGVLLLLVVLRLGYRNSHITSGSVIIVLFLALLLEPQLVQNQFNYFHHHQQHSSSSASGRG